MSFSNIYPYIDYDIFINARQKPIGFHLALRSDDHSSPALKEPGFSGHLNKADVKQYIAELSNIKQNANISAVDALRL